MAVMGIVSDFITFSTWLSPSQPNRVLPRPSRPVDQTRVAPSARRY